MAKHNKKRNVGLLHEQLVRHISENIVRGNKKRAEQAILILQHHFREDAELYREYRLFNALVHTKVPDRTLARQIITESKTASKNHDANKLRVEKSGLIKEINHKLDEENFYARKIEKYKIFATVQALLNEWRGAQKLSPHEIVSYERVLEDWLVREVEEPTLKCRSNANPLTLKIMTEKFNKRYKVFLNEEQQSMIENCLRGDEAELNRQIESIKHRALRALTSFYQSCDNSILLEKRDQLEKKVMSMESSSTGECISRAMVISALIKELEGDDE